VAAKTEPRKPERVTLAGQLARQHELLMAQATKPARTSPQATEWGERATGDKQGHLYFKSVQLVQRDDESDLQFLGREEQHLRERIALRDTLNAEADARAVGANGDEA